MPIYAMANMYNTYRTHCTLHAHFLCNKALDKVLRSHDCSNIINMHPKILPSTRAAVFQVLLRKPPLHQ